MTSYFSLLLRPYYSSASRDMKELFLLATAIDELRQGRLGTLGDSLASRFIAIQTAMSDGSWKSAQFLEMHPLENNSPAPMPLLLQARKHAKVVDRSLRVDEGGRRGNWRNQDTRGHWQKRRERKRQRRQRKGQWKERKRKRTKFLGLRISGRRLEFLGKPEFRPRLVEQKEGRQGCRQEEGRREERVEEKRSYKRGEEASPFSEGWMELSWVAEQSCNLRRIGILMAWLIIQGELLVEANRGLHSPVLVAVLGWVTGDGAVQRPLSQEVFPFPLGELGPLVIALQACSRGDLVSEDFVQTWAEMAWLYVSIRFLNGLHGIRAIPLGGWKKSQLRGVVSLKELH